MNFSIFIQKNPDFSDFPSSAAAETLRIVFRERITAFSSVYELLYVDGMTEAYFTEIRDSVQIYGDIAPE